MYRIDYLQLNNLRLIHIFYNQAIICQAIIWHGIVSGFLKIFTDLQEICSIKTQNIFLLFLIAKTILHSYAANFLQICANLLKYQNNAMSNDGSSIKIIDQCHGDWAVKINIKNLIVISRSFAPKFYLHHNLIQLCIYKSIDLESLKQAENFPHIVYFLHSNQRRVLSNCRCPRNIGH